MCITESDLIRQLTQPSGAVAAHLEGCAACRARWEMLCDTWDLLADLDGAAPPVDLTPRVLAALPSHSWRWLRAAAGIVLAVGVGAATALRSEHPARPETEVSGEAVVEVMGLDAVGADTGLADVWLDAGQERSL